MEKSGEGIIIERRIPTGLAAVGLVLALSLGSGLVVGVGLSLLAWACGWPFALVLAGAGAAVIAVWVWALGRFDDLAYSRERVIEAGRAAPARELVSVEVAEPSRGRVGFLDLPGSPDALGQLARGVLAGRTFAEASWSGRGRPYSKGEFQELRSVLLERGLMRWRNEKAPAQGVELTRGGRVLFQELAERPRTHAPAGNGSGFALGEGQE